MKILSASLLAASLALNWVHAQQSNSIVPTAITDQNRTGPLPFSTSYGGKFDHIDGTSGNLSIEIPIFHTKGRGMDFDLALRYEGNFWATTLPLSGGANHVWATESRSPIAPNIYLQGWEWNQPYMSNSLVKASVDCGGDQLGSGGPPSGGGGVLPPDSQLTTWEYYILTDPQGGKHAFDAVAGTGDCVSQGTAYEYSSPSPDLSNEGYWAFPVNVSVIGPDGEQYQQGGQGPFATTTNQTVGLARRIDVNGNQKTEVVGGTDTLNRQPITQTVNGNTITLTYHDPNGATQTATLQLQEISVTSSFNQTMSYGGGVIYDRSGTSLVLSSVTLANGTSYQFTYGSDGYLNTMTLPTGSVITYTTAKYLAHEASREYVSQRSESVGGQTNNTTFAITCNNGTSTLTICAQVNTVVTDAAQKRAVFVSTDGHILSASFYDDPSGTKLLKQYTLCYGSGNTFCTSDYTNFFDTNGSLKPISINTTLDNGLVSRVEYDYDSFTYSTADCSDSDPSFCSMDGVSYQTWTGSRGNETAMREYDYGTGAPGPLIRQTLKSYLHDSNPNYFQDSNGTYHNIVNKVTQVSVYDGSQVCTGGQTCSANLLAQTNYGYDEDGAGYRGRVTSVSKWVNLPQSQLLTTHYQYDTYGNITQITDPKGNTTTWSYADNWNAPGGQCLPASGLSAFPTSETNALGQVTKVSYYPCSGDVASFQDPNDLAASRPGKTFTYDLMGRLVSSSMPDGGLSTTTYNDQALTVDSKTYQNASNAIEKFSVLDGLGRTTQTRLLSDPSGTVYVDTVYDSLGRVYSTSNPYRSTSDPTYGLHYTTFDGLGRKLAETAPDSTSITYSYSGNVVTTFDEALNSWQRISDALGRLTKVVEPGSLTTTYGYDPLGNLKTVVQSGTGSDVARNRSFTYDSLSRLLNSTNPETGTLAYAYDANSNVLTKTDARGTVTHLTYDSLNRLTLKTYSDGTLQADFAYDSATTGNFTAQNTIGRLTEVSNGYNTSTQYSYDPMGRIILQGNTLPNGCCVQNANEVAAQYDIAGEMTDLFYPDGSHIHQTFDTAGRLGQPGQPAVANAATGQQYLESVSYAPDSSPQLTTLGNGIQQSIQKNNRLQVQSSSVTNPLAPSGSQTFLSRAYAYGAGCATDGPGANNGNICSITDGLSAARSQSFTYDPLNRISTFSLAGAVNQQFQIDSFGNMSGMVNGQATTTFDPATNRISNLPCAQSTAPYDAKGNQLCDTDQNGMVSQYTYDAENRITSINTLNGNASPFASYIYGADGARVRKQDGNGNFTEYTYFNGQPIAEKDQTGAWTDYVYANGQRIATLAPEQPGQAPVENVIQITGTGNTGSYISYTTAAPALAGYTIQQGDQLLVRERQSGSFDGGILIFANNQTTYPNDADGQRSDDDTITDRWHTRVLPLDALAGLTYSGIWFGGGTGARGSSGPFTVQFASIGVLSQDGTLRPIYNGGGAGLSYVNGTAGTTAATTLVPTDNNATRFYVADHLGSAQMEFSSSGLLLSQSQFAPFGAEINPQPTTNHYKFTGKERDAESGLDYFGARYYASNMGRWMSPDVVNVTEDRMMNPSSTLNKYAYGANNPLKYIDPDGEDITIFYRPDALGLPGHIMILAYNQDTGDSAIRSYGPVSQGLSALVSTPGTDSFGFANIKSPDDLRSQYGTITIKTTPEEAQKVIQEIRTHPDGNYGVFNSNCTTICRNLLKKIGKTDPHGLQNSPSGFFFQLLKENGYNVPTGKIQGSTYGQLRPGYDPFALFFNDIPQNNQHEKVTSKIVDWQPLPPDQKQNQ